MSMIDTDNNKNNTNNSTIESTIESETTISTTITQCGVLIIEWDDLINENTTNLNSIIEQAYGLSSSIGILAIRNVPNFVQAKQILFPKIYTLAVQLSNDYREQNLTNSDSLYNTGWSYGKEKIGISKKPDTNKGSYYFNPITDTPGCNEEDRINYPYSYPCNIWPSNEILPGFQNSAKELGILLTNVAIHMTKHIDTYVHSKNSSYPLNFLYNHLSTTDKVKGRLLYYYPFNDDNNDNNENETTNDDSVEEDSWIGWHNDSGFITALAGEMYVDHETGTIVPCPDNDAGLYVHICSDNNDDNDIDSTTNNTTSMIRRIVIPDDCCAIQIGECIQIITGGIIRATPHCVRGPKTPTTESVNNKKIGRISFPCFVDTIPSFLLSSPVLNCTRDSILLHSSTNSSSTKVPPLSTRWLSNTQTFNNFLQTTFLMYYNWNTTIEK